MGARLALVSLLALLPLASAVSVDDAPIAETEVCAAPPCGYILPYIDIVIEDKMVCGGGRLIFAEGLPDDCEEIPLDGESRDYAAKLLWYWEVSEDGTYPKEYDEDIFICFGSTSTNVAWIQVEVTADGTDDAGCFIIDNVALAHPDNLQVREGPNGNQQVWFWFERDITITVSRDGGPNKAELKQIDDREGVQSYFIKAKSSSSGPRFKESFTVEEMRWGTCNDDTIAPSVSACGVATLDSTEDQDAPGIGLVALMAALAAIVIARRR